jgi:hypothetical protein
MTVNQSILYRRLKETFLKLAQSHQEGHNGRNLRTG